MKTACYHSKNKREIWIDDGKIWLSFPYDAYVVTRIRNIYARAYSKKEKIWWAPLNYLSLVEASKIARELRFSVPSKRIDDYNLQFNEFITKGNLSWNDGRNLENKYDERLRPYQVASLEYVLSCDPCRVLIADDMGLGKTVISLMAMKEKKAYPALVVCPANVKLKWQREVNRWLGDDITTEVLYTRKPWKITANVSIINYEILDAWKHELCKTKWKCIITDECHRVKNKKAKMSVALTVIAKKTNPPIRLGLSGTPVKNRPIEFVNQFTFMGVMDMLGKEWGYLNRFCKGPTNSGGYSSWNGSGTQKDQKDLGKLLRTSIMCRHLKKSVEDQLPDKQRTIIEVDLTNREEYEQAEYDFSEWVVTREKGSGLDELSKMTILRGIAAEGKTDAVMEQVVDIVESGHKVVVFAYHKRIQSELFYRLSSREKFPSGTRIFSEDSVTTRDENVQMFQTDPDCRWIVCSLMAAKEGIDLYAADHAVFAELVHTPTDLMQAEDRIHRIGQTSQQVNIYYIIGKESIDQDLMDTINRKLSMIQLIVNGREDHEEQFTSELSTGSVTKEAISKLIERRGIVL